MARSFSASMVRRPAQPPDVVACQIRPAGLVSMGAGADATGRTSACDRYRLRDRAAVGRGRWPDPEAGVRELRRITRPGGRVLAALNGVGNMRQLAQLIAGICRGPGRDPSTLRLDAAHFARVEVERFDDTLLCTDPADVIAYVESLPLRPQAVTVGVAQCRPCRVRAGGRGVQDRQGRAPGRRRLSPVRRDWRRPRPCATKKAAVSSGPRCCRHAP